jgi:hypothetical protein
MIIAMYEDNWQISKVKWVSHVIWGLRNGLWKPLYWSIGGGGCWKCRTMYQEPEQERIEHLFPFVSATIQPQCIWPENNKIEYLVRIPSDFSWGDDVASETPFKFRVI